MKMADWQRKNSILVRFIVVIAVGVLGATVMLTKRYAQPVPERHAYVTSKCRKPTRSHPDNPKVRSSWHIPRNSKDYIGYIQHFCLEESQRKRDGREPCPCVPNGLGAISVTPYRYVRTWEMVKTKLSLQPLMLGGYWSPNHCQPRRRVAILIPFRDRESHLMAFLAHNVKIWQKQLIEFRIFVVEQRKPDVFNKGALMNAGYLELRKRYDFDCLLLHDVDMLMENELNIVHCGEHVVHHGAYVNKMQYRMMYFTVFGGAICLKPELFEKINGYSNKFFGWGGEDDNFFRRLLLSCSSWFRAPDSIARFHMIRHRRDKNNPVNNGAWHQVEKENKLSYLSDGLNTVNYVVNAVEERSFFTWILLDIIPPAAGDVGHTNGSRTETPT